MVASQPTRLAITWEKLPADYLLPDDPVDNIAQPLLAAALQESLELAGLITPEQIIATNFGICTKVNGQFVVKAPDWVYVKRADPIPPYLTRRSYTPHKEGEIPLIVMEFLSDTDGGEYSLNPRYPYGKWYFYEQILQVPFYILFEPEAGELEVYQRIEDRYQRQGANEQDRYWLAELDLFLGVWDGEKVERTGYWLRWWNEQGELLPWAVEKMAQDKQLLDHANQRAQEERQRAEQAEADVQELRALLAKIQSETK